MSHNIDCIKKILLESINSTKGSTAIFFKTYAGGYAEHDQFIGVRVPILRKIAKKFLSLTCDELSIILESPINEERLLALIILSHKYKISSAELKEELFKFYTKNLKNINNWNLVDTSAHLIVGAYLWNRDKSYLIKLATSKSLWERRIAIVSTLYFIRKDDLEWTFKIASILQNDSHDLIHKAVGWMLREAGKKDILQLTNFLENYKNTMPRTMLRYAIEKFPKEQRKLYIYARKLAFLNF